MAVHAPALDAPGTPMPEFALTDVFDGTLFTGEKLTGASAVLVAFICRHCPYVVHVRDELARVASEFAPRGVKTLGISANDPVRYPDDAPERLREMVLEYALPFPVLFDESQDVARAFGAVCTPDLFLYDGQLRLFYRGRLDESTPGNEKPVTGNDLRHALKALLAGEPLASPPQPSMGCSIKWR